MAVLIEQRPTLHRFTVEDLYKMDKAGIFADGVRVELIEGKIIRMAAIGDWHAIYVNRLNDFLVRNAGGVAIVSVQNPLVLSKATMTEPDLVLFKRRADFYAGQRPRPEDALLVIEVSDSTLRIDRKLKLPLYAAAQIPEVWIINVQHKRVEQYTEPSDGAYNAARLLQRGDSVDVTTIAGLTMPLDAIFD